MPSCYRLTKARFQETAFSGEGSRRRGGRWHKAGASVVYAADTPALALLELIVNVGAAELVRGAYVLFRAEFDSDLITTLSKLPEGWSNAVWPEKTRRIGMRWFEEETSPVLEVPSAVVPMQCNYLLNPLHPAFGKIEIGPPEPFHVDTRLAPDG